MKCVRQFKAGLVESLANDQQNNETISGLAGWNVNVNNS